MFEALTRSQPIWNQKNVPSKNQYGSCAQFYAASMAYLSLNLASKGSPHPTHLTIPCQPPNKNLTYIWRAILF